MQTQTIAPNASTTFNQAYLYDKLNRLTLAIENYTTLGTPVCPSSGTMGPLPWCAQFGDDRYGNMTPTTVNLGTFQGPGAFDAATNRMSPNNGASGWNYNLDGQLNRDLSNYTYAFDAEGRTTAFCPTLSNPASCSSQWASGSTVYTYDGDGKRVRKQANDGTVTTYVYDAAGALAAEYDGAPAATTGVQYLVQDALGSTRMVLNGSGCPTSRTDYLPYGAAVPALAGGTRAGVMDACDTANPYTYQQDSGVRQKFTGKERDGESGLDYFEARYYAS